MLRPAQLLSKIKNQIFHHQTRLIVLYGHRQTGKSTILKMLPEELGKGYIPIYIDGQMGQSAVENFSLFFMNFVHDLTESFNNWAERTHRKKLETPKDRKPNYDLHHAKIMIQKLYARIQELSDEEKLVIMYNKFGYLVENKKQVDSEIFVFLKWFIDLEWLRKKKKNIYFIAVSSEQIFESDDNIFSSFIAVGNSFEVKGFEEDVVASVLSAIRKYIHYEESILPCLMRICDGHPKILTCLVNSMLEMKSSFSHQKRKIMPHDIKKLLYEVIGKNRGFLGDLRTCLPYEEVLIMWLISRKIPKPTAPLEFSCSDLEVLHRQYIAKSTISMEKLEKGLKSFHRKGWIKWLNEPGKRFQFQLGIVPFWIHFYGIEMEHRHTDNFKEEGYPAIWELDKKIVNFFLTSIPNIHDRNVRQALLLNAGLDTQLQNQLDAAPPPTLFFPVLVRALRSYGTLEDGRHPLKAVLEAAKDFVGQQYQKNCDILIQELDATLPGEEDLFPHYDIPLKQEKLA